MEEAEAESSGTGLVVYSKCTHDIAKVVQKTASLSDLQPENRMAVPGGMFVASCDELRIDPSGILGILVLTYFEEVAPEPPKESDLLGKMLKRFLPQGIISRFDLTHEGKNYRMAWRVQSRRHGWGSWITLNGSPNGEAIGYIKTEAIAKQQLLVANEFILDLFTPILNALLNFHAEMARF